VESICNIRKLLECSTNISNRTLSGPIFIVDYFSKMAAFNFQLQFSEKGSQMSGRSFNFEYNTSNVSCVGKPFLAIFILLIG